MPTSMKMQKSKEIAMKLFRMCHFEIGIYATIEMNTVA